MASGVPGMGAPTSLKSGDPIKAGDLRTRQAEVLFREAKERGIGCESCVRRRQRNLDCDILRETGYPEWFLCTEWKPTS